MKVLFISFTESPDDRTTWSGTSYQALQGLKRAGYEVDFLYAYRDLKGGFLEKLWCRYWLTVPKWFGKGNRMDESFYNVFCYKQTLSEFDYTPYDVIFVPADIAVIYTIPKHVKAKIVHLADATIDSLFGYYSEFSNLWFHSYWEAHTIGKTAFRKADLNIVSSEWCKQNAIRQYGCDPSKIVVIEFGANIDMQHVPATPKLIDGKKQLNVYWSGVNWLRKGGDVALECCVELAKAGYDINFNFTGMKENPIANLSQLQQDMPNLHINNLGFLNKNIPNEYRQLIEVMKQQDIFLFPSKAECSSIALCEANGFGLPCFVYDTGGTGNYVVNGQNGYMLSIGSDGKAFASRIIESIKSQELDTLSKGAVLRYKEKLNWGSWSCRVKSAIDNCVNQK